MCGEVASGSSGICELKLAAGLLKLVWLAFREAGSSLEYNFIGQNEGWCWRSAADAGKVGTSGLRIAFEV